jgi:hypothetical protein
MLVYLYNQQNHQQALLLESCLQKQQFYSQGQQRPPVVQLVKIQAVLNRCILEIYLKKGEKDHKHQPKK